MKFQLGLTDLLPRYAKAFGFVALDNFLEGKKAGKNFRSPGVFVDPRFNFADMTLKHPDFTINMGSKHDAGDPSAAVFAAPPMISISRSKVIQVTSPDRSEGEVVENWAKQSYDISLKGIIVDMENHWYPRNGVISIRHLFDINDVYESICPLLNDLGIYNIYFTEWPELTGVEGYADTLSYSLNAKSFQPSILTAYKP